MLKIDALNNSAITFHACSTSTKLAAQKAARQKAVRLAASGVETLSEVGSITKPQSQVIDDIGMFMAKQAQKRYAVTSEKLAKQKSDKFLAD